MISIIYISHAGSELTLDMLKEIDYKEKVIGINGREISFISRIIRKKTDNLSRLTKGYWFNYCLKKNNVIVENKAKNTIILYDTPLNFNNVEYIRKKYNKCKIIFWYWNIVRDPEILEKVRKNVDYIFTFDKEESLKYDLKFSPQFYWRRSEIPVINGENTEVYFIGKDKGRFKKLSILEKEFQKLRVSYNIKVMRDKNIKYPNNTNLLITKNITYQEVLSDIKKSNVLLELNQSLQSGLTIRALEALFLGKKLITDNKKILEYDFYNKNNIYVLDENLKIDEEFFKTKLEKINTKIIKKYSAETWLDNLTNN